MDLALLIEDCFFDSILSMNLRDFAAVFLARVSTFSNELPRRENKGLSQSDKDGLCPMSLQNDVS
jgi:hypothetical protein